MTFYKLYAECCRQKGIAPVSRAAAEKTGCSKANISAFAKTGITRKGDVVGGAAKMLNVSSDYLLRLIDEPRTLEDYGSLTLENRNN